VEQIRALETFKCLQKSKYPSPCKIVHDKESLGFKSLRSDCRQLHAFAISSCSQAAAQQQCRLHLAHSQNWILSQRQIYLRLQGIAVIVGSIIKVA